MIPACIPGRQADGIDPAAAFFDVDDTIIRGFTIAGLIHSIRDDLDDPVLVSRLLELERLAPMHREREQLTVDCFELLAGQAWSQMLAWGQRWYESTGRSQLISPTIDRLHEHRVRGDKVVFVTGSWRPCVEPIANDLDVDAVYCCEVGVEADKLTGAVSHILVAEGKAEVARNFASQGGIALANCYAYGNDWSDAQMLAAVGHPVAVRPTAALAETATAQGWEILN